MGTKGALRGLGQGLLNVGDNLMQSMLAQQRDEAAARLRHEYGLVEADKAHQMSLERDDIRYGREMNIEDRRDSRSFAERRHNEGLQDKRTKDAFKQDLIKFGIEKAADAEKAGNLTDKELLEAQVYRLRTLGDLPRSEREAAAKDAQQQIEAISARGRQQTPSQIPGMVNKAIAGDDIYGGQSQRPEPQAPEPRAQAPQSRPLLGAEMQPEPSNYVEKQDPYQLGKTYAGKDGSRAKYLGNGKWQKL